MLPYIVNERLFEDQVVFLVNYFHVSVADLHCLGFSSNWRPIFVDNWLASNPNEGLFLSQVISKVGSPNSIYCILPKVAVLSIPATFHNHCAGNDSGGQHLLHNFYVPKMANIVTNMPLRHQYLKSELKSVPHALVYGTKMSLLSAVIKTKIFDLELVFRSF